jgi:hypothetical protein
MKSSWTRRSTGAWLAPSCTLQRRGRTSSFLCVCALVFRRRQGLRIGKPSRRIFKYLRYTPELGLWGFSSLSLLGFSDASFAGCRVDRKSILGTCQFLGSSHVSWSSREQSCVAQSTTEAEYVAAASCCSQLLWITYTLSDFGEECSHVPHVW